MRIPRIYEEESALLRSKILTLEHNTGKGRHTKYNYKAFSEIREIREIRGFL